MNIEETIKAIRALGLSAGYNRVSREYRITPRFVGRAKSEAMAYYTNNSEDAIATARKMREYVDD